MTRKIEVVITGDARPLKRSLGEAATATSRFEGQIKGLSKSLLLTGAAFVGAGSIVEGAKSLINVTIEAEKTTANLNQTIVTLHGSVKKLTPAIEEADKKGRAWGFTNDETEKSLTKLFTAVGANNRAFDLNRVAMDLSRKTGDDLSISSQKLILILSGNLRAAKQFGIVLPDWSKKTWAMKAAQDGLTISQEKGLYIFDKLKEKVKGQADAYSKTTAGAMAKFHASLQNIEVMIGKRLTPTIDKYVNKISDWLEKGQNQKKITDDVTKAIDALKQALDVIVPIIKTMWDYADKLANAFGGWKKALELLIAIKISLWLAGMVGGLRAAITAITGEKGLLAGIKLLRESAALPIVFAVLWSISQQGEQSVDDKTPNARVVSDSASARAMGRGGAFRAEGGHVFIFLGGKGQNAIWYEKKDGLYWSSNSSGDPAFGTDEDGAAKSLGISVKELRTRLAIALKNVKYVVSGQPVPKGGHVTTDQVLPAGRAAAGGGALVGTPGQGTHSYGAAPNNWQSDEAVDIDIKPGQAILAAVDGVIHGPIHTPEEEGMSGRFSGGSFYLWGTDGNDYWYKHIKAFTKLVRVGQRVRKGDVLGHGSTTGHLHFAMKPGGLKGVGATPTPGGGSTPSTTPKATVAPATGHLVTDTQQSAEVKVQTRGGTALPAGWAEDVLDGIGAPHTRENIAFLQAWQRREGGSTNNTASYNPLCTTLRATGSVSMNKVGVQAYPDWATGCKATVDTLLKPAYKPLVTFLRAGGGGQRSAGFDKAFKTWSGGAYGDLNVGGATLVAGSSSTTKTPTRPDVSHMPPALRAAFANAGDSGAKQLPLWNEWLAILLKRSKKKGLTGEEKADLAEDIANARKNIQTIKNAEKKAITDAVNAGNKKITDYYKAHPEKLAPNLTSVMATRGGDAVPGLRKTYNQTQKQQTQLRGSLQQQENAVLAIATSSGYKLTAAQEKILAEINRLLQSKFITPATKARILKDIDDLNSSINSGIADAASQLSDYISGIMDDFNSQFEAQTASVAASMRKANDAIIQGQRDALEAQISAMNKALSQQVAAMEKSMQQHVQKMQDAMEKHLKEMQVTVQGAFPAFQFGGNITETPTEKLLKQMSDQREEQGRQQALTDAMASGDAKAIADALYDIKVANLQKQADAERDAADTQLQDAKDAYQKQAQAAIDHYQEQKQAEIDAYQEQEQARIDAYEKEQNGIIDNNATTLENQVTGYENQRKEDEKHYDKQLKYLLEHAGNMADVWIAYVNWLNTLDLTPGDASAPDNPFANTPQPGQAVTTTGDIVIKCFVAGTQISIPGGTKNIEDVQVGDEVLCWDFSLGDVVTTVVEATQEHNATEVLEITTARSTGFGSVVTTPEHQMFEEYGWKEAGSLTQDDSLFVQDGVLESILSLAPQKKKCKVYNFHVKHDDHNYFANSYLVHNKQQLASGGLVTRPTYALIGERGPEMVLPLGSAAARGMMGGGGITINLYVDKAIGSDLNKAGKELVEPIRRELLKKQRRNVNSGFN